MEAPIASKFPEKVLSNVSFLFFTEEIKAFVILPLFFFFILMYK